MNSLTAIVLFVILNIFALGVTYYLIYKTKKFENDRKFETLHGEFLGNKINRQRYYI